LQGVDLAASAGGTIYTGEMVCISGMVRTGDVIGISGTIRIGDEHPTNSPTPTPNTIDIHRLNPPRSLQRPRAENHDCRRAHPCHFSPGTTSSEK
jgi:hypothetical protein